MVRRWFVSAWVLPVCFCIVVAPCAVHAQDPSPDPPADPAPSAAAADPQQARAEFDQKFTQWKDSLKELRTLRHEYQVADETTREDMEVQYKLKVAAIQSEMLPVLIEAARKAYAAAPDEDRELTRLLVSALEDDLKFDRYESAAATADVLLSGGCDMPQVYRDAGIAFFALNDPERTQALLDKADTTGIEPESVADLRQEVQDYAEYWKQEREAREREAAADDLPRVKLTTTKGDITLELFENEAPETVGNFVSLVKQGFYDGLTFHRVMAGFMAQAGCPEGDGSGGPGYSIYDECKKPEARKHFRGSLSMAKTGAPNSGGSQFFICIRPTAHLNNVHTVFGRVIEGLEVLENLQRRDPSADDPPEPDRILTAVVVRDRGHEYVPRKVE